MCDESSFVSWGGVTGGGGQFSVMDSSSCGREGVEEGGSGGCGTEELGMGGGLVVTGNGL